MATAYELLEESKKRQQAAIAEAHKAQEGEKKLREHNAQQQLEANNRGVYTTYKNAINPFGVTASQNNMPTGVSDYMKNAAYGTMLQGLGKNRTNFTTEINNSNTLWQNWLAEKAGKEAAVEDNYATAMIAADKASGSGYGGYGGGNGNGGNGNGGNGGNGGGGGGDDTVRIPARVNTSGVTVDSNKAVSFGKRFFKGKIYEYGYNKNGQVVSVRELPIKEDVYSAFSNITNQ